jgi:aminopeptidase N
LLWTLLGAASTSSLAAEPSELGPESRDFDQVHLELRLTLDVNGGTLAGEARHRMTSLADGLRTVRLHLEDLDVSSATTGEGDACAVTHEKGILSLELDRPRAMGEEFELVIQYGGKPTSGLWFFRPDERHPRIPLQVWSQGQGTENRHWFPCYDLPDDRLTTYLEVDVPAGLTTLSNGEPVFRKESRPGREVHAWSLSRPHPSYLVTLVVGTFDHVRNEAAGVEQHLYMAPGWGEHADEVFGRTGDMMGFFAKYTGQPYPWRRYSQVTVWDFMWGGMENTSATTLNMRALHGPGVRPDYSADGLIAHELAHMWFGDLVTCRTFDHIWLNEGFATYFTDLWVEHHHGEVDFEVARLHSRDRYMDAVDHAALAVAPRPAQPTDCGDVKSHAYVKGSSILHMLRRLLGDEVFRDGVREYVTRCADRSVDSEELRAALEKVSGRNLRGFFEQWVYGSGFPVLHVSTEWQPDGETDVFVFRVRQAQPATPEMPHFRTPVDVEVTWEGGESETFRFALDGPAAEWRVRGLGKPRRWRVDPWTWLIAKVDPQRSREEWELQLLEDVRATGRILAARALADLGPKGVPALSKAATEDVRHEVRAEAAKALGATKAHAAARALITASGDADSRVRSAALEAMGEMPPQWVAETLMTSLRDDPSGYAAAAAAAALGKTRAPGAFDALSMALTRDSHRDVIRREVMNGMKALGDVRGAQVAEMYTHYGWGKGLQHRLRHAAIDAMVALDPHGAATHATLAGLLDDPYFRMRRWAAAHVADVGMATAIPALEELIPGATGPGVRTAYEKALERLQAK